MGMITCGGKDDMTVWWERFPEKVSFESGENSGNNGRWWWERRASMIGVRNVGRRMIRTRLTKWIRKLIPKTAQGDAHQNERFVIFKWRRWGRSSHSWRRMKNECSEETKRRSTYADRQVECARDRSLYSTYIQHVPCLLSQLKDLRSMRELVCVMTTSAEQSV